MRINENIFNGKGNFLDNAYRNYQNSEIIRIEDNVLYAKSNDAALFYINIDTNDFDTETITISADIGNRGNIPLYIQIYGIGIPFSEKMVNVGETYRLEHVTELRSNLIGFRIVCKESGDLGFYCRNIKIEKGDKATPYIPNINTLPEDKQPLLPPEGHYKEIQAL